MANENKTLSDMQSRFPHIYDVYNENSIIYALLSVYAEKFNDKYGIINRLYAMIGIESTYDEDLEHRWGSLLGVYRQSGESYKDYRSRLMIVYTSLVGGTAEAIKYAIASTIGISSDIDIINKYISVYDAWAYDGDTNTDHIDKSYGNIICTIDLSVDEGISSMEDKIIKSINATKASGITPYLMFIYIINEIASIHMDDYSVDKINETVNDSITFAIVKSHQDEDNSLFGSALFGTAIFNKCDYVDEYFDRMIQRFTEGGTISRSGFIGSTNNTMITNRITEVDLYDDRIYTAIVSESQDMNMDDSSVDTVKDKVYDEYGVISSFIKQSKTSSLFGHAIIGSMILDECDYNDQFADEITETISESATFRRYIDGMWSDIGTNSAFLNGGLITNMLAEIDQCVDIIIYKGGN